MDFKKNARLILYVGCANKMITIIGFIKIGIEFIRHCDVCM